MDLGLSGRVCVVTGASRGIGRATAERLAAEGARVLLVGRDRDALHDAAAACEGRGHVLVQDVTAPGAAAQVADAAQGLGTPWALVNNAGTSFARGMDELTDADWHALYDLHVVAPMRLMKALQKIVGIIGIFLPAFQHRQPFMKKTKITFANIPKKPT